MDDHRVFSPIRWRDDELELLDQTMLPDEETWLVCRTPEDVADAIRRLAVRGAPAIGVAAAYGLVVGTRGAATMEELSRRFEDTRRLLASTRPTAVNLTWALDRGAEVYRRTIDEQADASHDDATDPAAVVETLLHWAHDLHARDVDTNRRIAEHGAELFADGDRVITHCNAGALATAGIGTAVGVVTAAHARGRVETVWVDETRPLLQGARLTAWELGRQGVPFRLVTDSSVGALMARGMVDRAVVGADRIAANGDVANKIGTYVVAVLAARHGVPFYVAAPRSTIDPATPTGAEIPIEERAEDEITRVIDRTIAPDGTRALNLAFDVTPHELVTGIITEVGVLEPPYTESIARALAES